MLKKHEHFTEIDVCNGFLFAGYTEEVQESFTLFRVQIVLESAPRHISAGGFVRAEEFYTEL